MSAVRVARFEYRRHVLSRRFLATTLGLPLLMLAIVGLSVLAGRLAREPAPVWGVVPTAGSALSTDHGGPRFANEEAALAATSDGAIEGFAVLEEDGRALLRAPAGVSVPSALRRVLVERARDAVLAEAPSTIREALDAPARLRYQVDDGPARGADELIGAIVLAFALPVLFIVAVLFSTSLLVTAVAEEKSGRLLELLLGATTPRALVAGKVLGLGLLSLTQSAVWLTTAVVVLRLVAGDRAASLSAALDPRWLAPAAAFFLLGYLMYAAIMVGIGVIVGEPRAAQQVSGVAALFLVLPFTMVGLLVVRPASPAASALSMLPPTAPAAMPMRLIMGAAAPWEVLLSLALLAASCWLAFRALGWVFAVRALGAGGWPWSRRHPARKGTQRTGRSTPTTARNAVGATASVDGLGASAAQQAGDDVAAGGSWHDVRRVALHELRTHLRRRSFLIATFGVPLVGLLVGGLLTVAGAAFAQQAFDQLGSAFELDELRRSRQAPVVGVYDPAGVLNTLAERDELPEHRLFSDPQAARNALDRGAVDRLYLLPERYPAEREVVEVLSTPLPPAGPRAMEALLRAALWSQAPPELLAELQRPSLRLTSRPLSAAVVEAPPRDPGVDLEREPLAALAPLAVAMLLYTSIFTASSFLLQSVTTEKEGRLIEILLSSTAAWSLLAGKMLGLGALGLLQIVVWASAATVLSGFGLLAILGLATWQLGPSTVGVLLLVFLLGYAFYASLMAAVGALVPSFQESGALTFVVLFPAWTPFFMLETLLAQPEGAVARALTWLPPTAPLVLSLRLALDRVAPWEVALSLGLLAAAVGGVVAVAARLFRASVLLRGGGGGWTATWRALRSA